MKKPVQITLVLLALGIVSWPTYFNRRGSESNFSPSPSTLQPALAENERLDAPAKDRARSVDGSEPTGLASPTLSKPYALPALNESNFKAVYSLASNLQDAVWLRSHGYPASAQLREYNLMPLGELESLARAGDLVAKVIAGIKLTLAYKNPDGLHMLRQAAIEGSVYALSSLSSVYAAPGPYHDPVLAEAYRRLALTRGDYAVAELPRSENMSRLDFARAEVEYLGLAREYAQARIERNLPPLSTEIRPGLDEYLNRLRESTLQPVKP